MATINLTINDPFNGLGALPLLAPTLQAAVDYIDRYIVFRGTPDIEINVESTSTGRFAGNGSIAYAGKRDGLDTWESSFAAESRTGVDPSPNPDISIFIDPTSSYLGNLWWDPDIAVSLNANPPNDLTDAFSVIVHELLHGMGIVGWRDINTGALPGDYQSVWDSLVSVADGHASFTGAATMALVGQPVEVRLGGSQGAFHLGNGPDPSSSLMPWIEGANFNSYYFYEGERYALGRLELALLQDIGWTLESGLALTDVVNTWDDRETARYMVGWDDNDQMTGGLLGDRLEGRAGNDTLIGGSGNDTLTGGAGKDSFNFDAAQSSGVDRISDFAAEDNLNLQNLALISLSGTGTANALGQGAMLVGPTVAGLTTLYLGTDATAGADLTIELQGSYAASDFSFGNDAWGATVNYSATSVTEPSGANLVAAIQSSTGVPLNAVLQATLTARLQQMFDTGTYSALAASVAMQAFSTSLKAVVDANGGTGAFLSHVSAVVTALGAGTEVPGFGSGGASAADLLAELTAGVTLVGVQDVALV